MAMLERINPTDNKKRVVHEVIIGKNRLEELVEPVSSIHDTGIVAIIHLLMSAGTWTRLSFKVYTCLE